MWVEFIDKQPHEYTATDKPCAYFLYLIYACVYIYDNGDGEHKWTDLECILSHIDGLVQ